MGILERHIWLRKIDKRTEEQIQKDYIKWEKQGKPMYAYRFKNNKNQKGLWQLNNTSFKTIWEKKGKFLIASS